MINSHRHYSRVIWTSFYWFWAHIIWMPKLKIKCPFWDLKTLKMLCFQVCFAYLNPNRGLRFPCTQSYSVHPQPLSAGGGGGGGAWASNKIFKRGGGLTGSQFLEGGCWEDGHDLGRGGKFDGIGVKDEKFEYYGSWLKNLIFKVSSRKTNIYRGIA